MVLLTTYLAHLTTLNRRFETITAKVSLKNVGLKNPKIYYVMRNRGNNEVAPSELLLLSLTLMKEKYGKQWGKVGKLECWAKYKAEYLDQLERFDEALEWMKRVAEESTFCDVVLVCYEKDHLHCHRTLLAKTMTKKFPEVNYVGELRYSP